MHIRIRRVVLAALAAATLAGCAARESERAYRDRTGSGRQQAQLEQSMAECRYDFSRAQAAAPVYPNSLAATVLSGPGPRMFDDCMSAKGWELVYTR